MGFHSARRASIACSATCSVGAVTPTKSPSRTTATPGIASASRASSEAKVAPKESGRSTFPRNVPGVPTSGVYLCFPVTKSRPSTLETGVPAIFHSETGVVAGSSATVVTSFRPLVNAPMPISCPLSESTILPPDAASDFLSAFHKSPASSINRSRAVAATLRSWTAMSGVVRLPKVPASKGVNSVSAMVKRIEPVGTRSSSATTCVSDVRMFCPTSALPVKMVTTPSSPMWSQAPISCGQR